MARLTMAQAYAYARQAGFDPASAVIAAAIGMAESGLNTSARGDLGLQDAVWGPSAGPMQIRTVKSDTGKGTDRDIARIGNDPLQNMIAAYDISKGGRDWSPWTTYTDGDYRQYLGQARAAAGTGAAAAAVQPVGWFDTIPGAGQLGDALRYWGLVALGVAAGGTLLVLGGYRALGSPKVRIPAVAL